MQRQAARMIKEDENLAKKKKSSPEPKVAVSKKFPQHLLPLTQKKF
jgi:hypothetical protein